MVKYYVEIVKTENGNIHNDAGGAGNQDEENGETTGKFARYELCCSC